MSDSHSELAIQNALAARLCEIESGLRLIKENYHLKNSFGTRGFVDILARDRHGLFVVIEVKKSNNTAREAIHEVLKYCEILRNERGIRVDQVRALIVSTDWRELLVPFSEMTRASTYPVEGVLINLGDNFPESLTCEPVSPLPLPDERDLSIWALRVSVTDKEDAEQKWTSLSSALTDVGIDHLIGLVVVPHQQESGILHIALGAADINDPRLPKVTEDEAVEDPEMHAAEYQAVCEVASQHPGIEVTVPEKLLRYMQVNATEVVHVYRSGRFDAWEDLIDDVEVAEMAKHSAGWNQISVMVSAKTSHSLAWNRLRARVDYTLEGNQAWALTLGLWLDEIEHKNRDLDIILKIYNPMDLLASIVHGYGGDLREYMAEISGAIDAVGDEGRLIHGLLTWNGEPLKELQHSIKSVYPTPSCWGIARATGGVHETDGELLKVLGLQYSLFEFIPGDSAVPYLLTPDTEGRLRRIPGEAGEPSWPGIEPLSGFLQQEELLSVIAEYRQTMQPVKGGEQWLVID
ncbi:endonuclease NucS domain-containing protein [Streptomyces xantholiticus]|uniref:Endonuclease NucS domain-containing protein n=1 Tax=Streptomyces xantholiticus TaxID=68285 RepID=A0ABV1UP28_9ACTN